MDCLSYSEGYGTKYFDVILALGKFYYVMFGLGKVGAK